MAASGEAQALEGALGAFVAARAPDILAEWERRVRALPAARPLDAPALRDHAPEILERLARALSRSGEGGGGADLQEIASSHARTRLAEGYDVPTAAAELAELRAAVIALWARDGGAAIAVRDLAVLNAVADEVTIRSVESFTRARERTLVALDRISSAALGTGDLRTFLPRLLGVLLETTPAADAAFVMLRDKGDVLRIRAAAGVHAELSRGYSARIGEGFAGTVAARAEPMLVRDAASDPIVLNPALKQQAARALYGVPLVHEGRVIGVAKMASLTAFDFTEEDRSLFRAMAQRATSIIVEAELVESRQRALEALEHGDAFFMLDRNWRYVLVNSSQERLSRKPATETLGQVFWELWPEAADPGSLSWREYHRCMEERVSVSFEEYFAPLDLWTAVTAYPVRDGGIAVFFRDVSDRKRLERERDETIAREKTALEELRRREAELARIFAVTPDLLGLSSTDGHLKRVNPAFTDVLGYSEQELLAMQYIDIVHPDDRAPAQREMKRLAEGAETRQFVVRLRRKDGEWVRVSWNASIDPESGLMIVAGRDVTEETRRSEFERQLIGIVSHDLRNPLHVIQLGARALLAREDLDDRTVKAITRIRANADRATRMVEDLLDFTRARVGQGIPISPRPASLHEIARAAVEDVRAVYPDRAIQVQASGDASGEWDPDRLAQVVMNLTVNALKYGDPAGAVTVATRGERREVTLDVHNVGNPIPPEEQPFLFEPYRRGDSARHDPGSLGLGLYIACEIVRAHGGKLTVESSADAGTTFTVQLPRRVAP